MNRVGSAYCPKLTIRRLTRVLTQWYTRQTAIQVVQIFWISYVFETVFDRICACNASSLRSNPRAIGEQRAIPRCHVVVPVSGIRNYPARVTRNAFVSFHSDPGFNVGDCPVDTLGKAFGDPDRFCPVSKNLLGANS